MALRSASRRETKRDVSLSKASLRAIEHLLVRYFADHWLRGSTPQTHIATDFPVDRMDLLNFIKMIAHTSLGWDPGKRFWWETFRCRSTCSS